MDKKSEIGSDAKSSEVLDVKLTWELLNFLLQEELTLHEKLTLMQKSKECLGVNSQNKGNSKRTGLGHNANTARTEYSCYICGKNDHILGTDSGKKYVDYRYVSKRKAQ